MRRHTIFSSGSRCFAIIAPILIGLMTGLQAQTPPIQPKIQETPLPSKVEITSPVARPADLPNRPLTADEAAAIALYHQPDIATARAGVEAAQGRVQQARSGLLPSLNTGVTYTKDAISPSPSTGGTGGGVSSSSGYQVTANVGQLLFDFNHTRDLVKESEAQQQAANAGLNRVQSDVVFQVKQAFYAYAQNQRLAGVNEANLRNQQTHLASAQARLDAGLGLPADVVRAEAAISNATFNLTLVRNNASVSAVQLAQLMGIDPRTPIETADAGEPAAKINNLDELVNTALKQRPEMTQMQAFVQAASHGVKSAKTGDYPSIGADVDWLQRGASFPPDRDTLSYGISLKWMPFDAGLTKGRIKEAQANLKSQQSQYEAQSQQIISEVSQAYLNMITAEQRIKTSDAEIANAEEALRLTDGRYSSGLGAFLDVLDAQTALLTARTNRVNAQSALDQARSAMAHAIGEKLNL